MFQAAIEVLQSRLVELPAVAVSLAKHLAVSAAGTEFRRDDEYRYAPVDSEPVALDRLVIDTPQVAIISRDLSILGARDRVGKK